jgi:DNA-binding transcriptional MerR regulator
MKTYQLVDISCLHVYNVSKKFSYHGIDEIIELLNKQDQEIQKLRKKNDELEEMIKTIDKVEFTHELVHILEKVEELKYG